MTPDMMTKQQNLEGMELTITSDFIFKHAKVVTDFFQNHMDLYQLLTRGSSTYRKAWFHPEITSHENAEADDDTSDDVPSGSPEIVLQPSMMNEGRAETVVDFFKSNQIARDAFIAYTRNLPQ